MSGLGVAGAPVHGSPVGQAAPNLLPIHLPPGRFPGAALAHVGWTGLQEHDAWWLSAGYDGLALIGHPSGTHVMPSDSSDACLVVSHHARHVRFEGLIFHAGRQMVAMLGSLSSNAPSKRSLRCEFQGCVFTDEDRPDYADSKRAKWGLQSYQADLVFEGCTWSLPSISEHGLYCHGFSKEGVLVDRCTVEAVGAEGLKFTARPAAQYYPPEVPPGKHAAIDGVHPARGASIVIKQSVIEGYAREGWGGGVVVQGSGANVAIKQSSITSNTDRPAFAMDAGGIEHFSPHGVAGKGPGNGYLALSNSVFVAHGPEHVPGGVNVLRAVSARGVNIRWCGVWGPGTRAELRETGPAQIQGCNTPELAEQAAHREIETAGDPLVLPAGVPFSEGLEVEST